MQGQEEEEAGSEDRRCPQQCRFQRRETAWHQNSRDLLLSQGLYLSFVPVFSEQFIQLRDLYLVTGVVSVLSSSSLWLSHLAQLGKKAKLVQKDGGGWERVSLCSFIPGAELLPPSL